MQDLYQAPWPAGVTMISKDEFAHNRHRLGKITHVEVRNLVSDPIETKTVVVGTLARLHLDGFSLGYYGEGPHGFRWLLVQLGIPYEDKDIFGHQEEDIRIFEVP